MVKYLITLFSIVLVVSSCELEVPTPKPLPVSPSDTLDWNLYVKFTYQNQTQVYYGLEPCDVKDIVFCEPPSYRNVEVGKEVYFKNFDNSVNMHFTYFYDKGSQRVMGNINGHSFVSNPNITDTTAYINLCGSAQNLLLEYDLFFKDNKNF